MDYDDEASKLLEKALSSFDGIISDIFHFLFVELSLSIRDKDTVRNQQPSSNVLSAAQTLALALQQCKESNTPSPPDKETAEIINGWLESFMPMKSVTLVSGGGKEPIEGKSRQSENAKKIARLLKKRRELLEKEKLKVENEEKNIPKPKSSLKDAKDLNQRSEPTSEEYDDEEPETITENSDSYDSIDDFRVGVLSKDLEKDESTSEDEEITWSCLQRSQKRTHETYGVTKALKDSSKTPDRKTPTQDEPKSPTASGKPPRFSNPPASLDRRQRSRSQSNRREQRDSKSRSTHSLREKDLNDKILISDKLAKDNSSSSCSNRRMSPIAWEVPPPPPFAPWDHHYYKHHMSSRDDLRSMDYYRRPCDPYRLGSCQELCHHPSTLSLSGNCENPYFHFPPPPPSCCNNHYYQGYQRQDSSSERVRRLQSDKDALQLQVQILTEQINAQSEKLKDFESTVNEKNMLITNTEDLLNREMLSRSSLETQKLELMSAISEMKLQQATLERENYELRSTYLKNSLTNLNNASLMYGKRISGQQIANNNQKNGNNGGALSGSHGNLSQNLSVVNTSSPEFNRQRSDIHYSSLPRQAFATSTMLSVSNGNNHEPSEINNSPKRNVAFADKDKIIDDSINIPQRNYTIQALTSPSMSQKHKGLRGIFEKIKSNNGNNMSLVEDSSLENENDFIRGGFRATASPRLGWSSRGMNKSSKPFKEWDIDMLIDWFDDLGLEYVIEHAKKWLRTGNDLLTCAPQDIDKELSLRSPLHRKKILLAVADVADQESDDLLKNAGKLDTTWVLRWLDDIGLPQHKDEFLAGRVDGRVLHRLTLDDLVTMHITSTLHVASLRRGIQLLREQNFNPECLIRRLGEIEKDKIVFWTSHCIMEWLRMVDLAEYAPNLRGSGVHGSLMVNEVKFNAELLADLLSIPSSKTLLRRHLQTHFKDLLGRELIQLKREAENTLGYQPLTITGKIKTPKKSQFSLKRKKSLKNDEGSEFSNYVCPMTGEKETHKEFDDLEDSLDGNGNCSKSNTSKTSVKSCFTAK
ncbi:CLUMA_CG010705, isoform B [Clunio marinus]|uniref:CLUMA_CG010705, isoform B n=1 Tax=Clunio marinus TaxID=568069 RepID=A0A1J1IAJ9_9DIPT|nr:CLUMA_CG010705, isoform B [Clunio marinus]